MNVGIIGTGAIAHKHAQAYCNIGYRVVACAASDPSRARAFADQYGCEPVDRWQELCLRSDVDYADVCGSQARRDGESRKGPWRAIKLAWAG